MFPKFYKNQFETVFWKLISEYCFICVTNNTEENSIIKLSADDTFLLSRHEAKEYEFENAYSKAALEIIGSNEIYKPKTKTK